MTFPPPLTELITLLRRLPGVGPRSAERMALVLLRHPKSLPEDLAACLGTVRREVVACPECGFFITEEEGCPLCSDPSRDSSQLCVVEQPTDILPLDRGGVYKGRYFVLGGKLSPLDNVGPENLRIEPLLEKASQGEVREIILAVSSDVEGEATSHYLADALSRCAPAVSVTRLAQGLPAGGGLEHADDLTLLRALQGRRRM